MKLKLNWPFGKEKADLVFVRPLGVHFQVLDVNKSSTDSHQKNFRDVINTDGQTLDGVTNILLFYSFQESARRDIGRLVQCDQFHNAQVWSSGYPAQKLMRATIFMK